MKGLRDRLCCMINPFLGCLNCERTICRDCNQERRDFVQMPKCDATVIKDIGRFEDNHCFVLNYGAGR